MTPDTSAWPQATLIRPLTGGYRSDPYLVSYEGGFAVIRRTNRTPSQLRWLASALKLAKRSCLRPPDIILTATGNLAANGWRMETFIQGEPTNSLALAELRGPLNRFHAAAKALPCCKVSAPRHLPKTLSRQLQAMLPSGLVSAIHGDVHPGNVLRTEDGKLCLIDWDEARTGPVDLDIMHLSKKSPHQRRAHLAIESHEGWTAEPAFTRNLVRRLRSNDRKMRLHGGIN